MQRADDVPFSHRDFLGTSVLVATRAGALEFLLSRLGRREKTSVAFANTNLLNAAVRHELASELSRHFLILNDGVGLDVLSLLCHGSRFPDNLNGTDFTGDLLAAVPSGTRVFLFGARPEVVARAAEVLCEKHPIQISGTCNGYISAGCTEALVRRINEARTDIVLVALGNPKQEQWILRHAAEVEAPLLMAVGAFLDFSAGVVPRAPHWVRTLRLEWLFRLMQEPSRLWRRYTVGGLILALALLRSRRIRSPQPAGLEQELSPDKSSRTRRSERGGSRG
jgi:beta-1,4-glucosyltransferase